jgi:hypothetical protein
MKWTLPARGIKFLSLVVPVQKVTEKVHVVNDLRCDSKMACKKNCYTGLFKMIVRVLTTCHTQYISDRSMQLHKWIKKFSKLSFMMCGVQYLRISPHGAWYKSEPPLKPSPLTCYKQFGTNSINV